MFQGNLQISLCGDDMLKINCVGDICPVPVIKTKKALADNKFIGLEIIVDNEIAVQNISKLLKSRNCVFATSQKGEHFSINISAVDGNSIEKSDKISPINETQKKATVVIISSELMGVGDDVLGKILMKGFIFALTQLEVLPKAVVFYNGGVFHTLENAETVKDLQYLTRQGVEILVCGTCLKHFNLLESLGIGQVSNMFEISESLAASGHVISF